MTDKMMTALALVLALADAGAAPRFVAGAYKHTAMNRQASHAFAPAPSGTTSWAFATGECGDEVWGDESAEDIAAANVAAFDKAGRDYIVSTGGQGGVFTCASDAGMERFVARYQSAHLVGFDFDIEAGQTPAQVASLVARAAAIQARQPGLRLSFTVATHAASDGSGRSLNELGEAILAAARAGGLRDFALNLMVMDYGAPLARNCVVRGRVCDMAASAIQAVRNVHARYGVPLAQIEVTAMIGVNDVPANDFTLRDARKLAVAVKKMGLAGLHFWSLDRDRPCPVPVRGASASCSGMADPAGAFGRVLAH